MMWLELALGKVDGDGGVVDDLGDRAVERGHARAGSMSRWAKP